MWADDSTKGRVLLLRGTVLVQQDGVRLRCQQAVVWIETKQPGVKHFTIYGEGSVRLENGSEVSESGFGLIELNTRADPTVQAARSPVAETSLANDPLVARGMALRNAPPPASPPVMQQARYEDKPNDPPAKPHIPPVQTTQIVGPAIPPISPPVAGPPPIVPGPGVPPPLPPPGVPPEPSLPPVIEPPLQRLSVSPRSASGFQIFGHKDPTDPDKKTFIITGGVTVTVRNAPNVGVVDIEADQVVIWTRGVKDDFLNNTNSLPENGPDREIEFYLAGNVELRQLGPKDSRLFRADEMYYDVQRNVAIALHSQIEFKAPPQFQLTDPVVFRADEIIQHAENQYEMLRADVFSSKLPSDPGLKVYFAQGTIENRLVPRLSTFGMPVTDRRNGEQDLERELYFRGRNVVFELEKVPFFWSPYLAGDLLDPLGPIEDVTFGYNKIFGFEFGTTLNVYDLLGIQPYEGTKWRLHFDGLTARGPALGSTFDFTGREPFGFKKTTYDGTLSGYAIYDDGFDVLGGGRGGGIDIPTWRGRALWREGVYDLPYGFQVQSQLSYLSDRDFLEQYFWKEFATDVNQDSYLSVKQSMDNWAWAASVDGYVGQEWFTRSERLPELTGHIYELPFIDQYVTYMGSASLGYYQLRPTNVAISPPTSYFRTDQDISTGRFDLMQELDVPFAAGPFKLVPYLVGDLADYTHDLAGNEVGRAWGGGGLRASIPFSRIYPDVESELWNLNGINHKIVFSANYLYAQTNVRFKQLPQIDRLNDDATDQAIRDIHPYENTFLPGGPGVLLSGYPLYDPQLYAVRALILNRIDTIDDYNVLQLDLRQRWQTHRGYPGNEHIVDWMTLDVSASVFPNTKDNFNDNFAFLQYDWTWNIGDRTTLTSTAWVDPETHGPREYTVGIFLNRPDRTNFYLGYRQIDPLQSRALTAALSYIFSPKYSMTLSTTYDFGTKQAESSSLVFSRLGSDIQVSLGVSYNAIQSSFGVLFEIVPNLVPLNKRPGAVGALGQGGLLTH
jgi:hypothetical protein